MDKRINKIKRFVLKRLTGKTYIQFVQSILHLTHGDRDREGFNIILLLWYMNEANRFMNEYKPEDKEFINDHIFDLMLSGKLCCSFINEYKIIHDELFPNEYKHRRYSTGWKVPSKSKSKVSNIRKRANEGYYSRKTNIRLIESTNNEIYLHNIFDKVSQSGYYYKFKNK